MNNLNSILIEGNIVKDAALKSTPKGTQVCEFTISSNRYFKTDDSFEKEVCFFRIVTSVKMAKDCYSKGKKGRCVRIIGRLKQERWQEEDGKHYARESIYIIADHVEFRAAFAEQTTEASDNIEQFNNEGER